MDAGRNQRLGEVARIAVRLESETGCPAQMLVAQWAVESSWGAKPTGAANYFGIKKAARHTKCCTVTTHEVVGGKRVGQALQFADYDSLDASCRDYAWLITHGSPYAAAWGNYQKNHDLRALIAAVAGTYATDPNYKALATAIAYQSNVVAAVGAVRTVNV